ncbi:WD40 repeat domain-containing protein [Streptomyces sporangiiformans]|uniref:WD40 repeat domain-containing protein n=1 Tax=Streptomyces sporangiiformans TaxID=2315329 RepID=A0A505D9T8_9ACTN|nr:WD40 repeat domain-containing protein [Streptomyces sporangiiformans]TPQ16176.1 WD40 repeat domain-containing protein [Streptomyces sporangiiformans]
MNVDELVRDSLREQAAEPLSVGPGFADRVLTVRRRRHTRRLAALAAATTAVVAIAVSVPMLDSGKDDVRLASEKNQSDIIAHPDQSPPRALIAAGDTALAAYYTWSIDKQTKDRAVHVRDYWLLNQKTGRYEKTTKWSFIDVAPGMRTAAVLEKDLPAKRIGLLDLLTGKVERWIPVDRGVAGVEFSPDGSKLVATTYGKNPDLLYKGDYDSDGDGKNNDWMPQWGESSRTGFYVIDVDSGESSWSAVSYEAQDLNVRQDFGFSHDGKLVYSGLTTEPHMQYYDFKGNEVDKPANEKYTHWISDAGVSPNGKLVAADGGAVLDAYTGKVVTKVAGGQTPLAWADDKRLVIWGCDPKKCDGKNEFRNQLLLVTIGSDKVVPLSDFRKASAVTPGRWTPMFSER